jgi:hypothetical protein
MPKAPKRNAPNQCKLDLNIVQESQVNTWSTEKFAQTCSISATARWKCEALLASTAALIAPADVPDNTANGLTACFGSSSAMALSTPT